MSSAPANESPAGALGFPWWLLLLPILVGAASRDLWAPDEPRYAEVAREVYEQGDFLVMHLCGDLYPDKPPLFFWLAGLLGRASGWSVLAMRFVSLAATAGTAWLVLRLGTRAWGRLEGELGAAVFLSTVMVTEIGGRLQIDPLLAFLTTAALVVLDTPAPSARAAGRAALLAGLLTGLGVLAKGPVALVLVGLPWLAWRVVLGRASGARAAPLARAGGFVLALGLPLAWAVAAVLADPALRDQLFFEQHLGKAVDGSRHPGPPWKHLLRMPLFLLPWTLPALIGLRAAWSSVRAGRTPVPAGAAAERDVGLVRAGAWLAVVLVFFSLLVSKRDLYLLPVYPAAALLAARVLARAVRAGEPARASGWSASALFALAGVALLGGAAAALWMPALAEQRADAPRAAAAGALLCGAGALVARAVRRGPAQRWLCTALGCWALFVAAALALCLPAIDRFKSPRAFAQRIAERAEQPSVIPCLGVHPEGYRFYGGIPVQNADSLEPAFASEGQDFLALVRQREWEEGLAPELRERLCIVDQERVGSRLVYLVGRAAGAPGTER